ncbi:MAG TPA: chemotaxis protein CheW [Candidatus Saccharimonadales bacterium]|nr:chemotaxis protein CheW [Candidatus Saccharimonadales bacterium]
MNLADDDAPAKQVQLEQFVVFRLGGEVYAVPILAVTEVVLTLDITPVPNAPDYILGLTNLRGKIVPVLDLEKKFNLNLDVQVAHRHIMVAQSKQKVLFGILVDEVTEVLKVPPDAIKPSPEMVMTKISAEYLGGVIVLAEGQQREADERMVLILNLERILSDKNIEELHAVQGSDQLVASSG